MKHAALETDEEIALDGGRHDRWFHAGKRGHLDAAILLGLIAAGHALDLILIRSGVPSGADHGFHALPHLGELVEIVTGRWGQQAEYEVPVAYRQVVERRHQHADAKNGADGKRGDHHHAQ